MKIRYVCEICGNWSYEKEETEACEAKGTPVPPPLYLVYAHHYNTGRRESARGTKSYWYGVFCVVRYRPDGHAIDFSCWAARDQGPNEQPNDNLGDTLCEGGTVYAGSKDQRTIGTPPDKERPAFKRMIAFLEEKKLPYVVLGDPACQSGST